MFLGLKILFMRVFPCDFILSTCSAVQVSMVKDLTLEMCVPSLRCRAAHRIHKKIPIFQLAHPGLKAPQSAHRSLPGTERMRSCKAFSFRCCCRLLTMLGILVKSGETAGPSLC